LVWEYKQAVFDLLSNKFPLMQAREARRKALEEMSEESRRAFEKLRFYKFYPVQTPDTPDISNVKVKRCPQGHNFAKTAFD
jgi:hypothetical protein